MTTTTLSRAGVPETAGRALDRIAADVSPRDLGLLALRATAGLIVAAHGAQKLFGWWGGPGLDAITNGLAQGGYTPARLFAVLLAGSEVAGGLLLTLGLLTPLASAAIIGVMSSAVVALWPKGLFALNGGYELALLLGIAAACVAFAGPGRLSLDRARPWALGGLLSGAVAIGVGVAGALIVLVIKAL